MKNIEEINQSQKTLLTLALKNHPAICDILVHYLNNKMKSLNYLIEPTKYDDIFQITSDHNIFSPYHICFTQHELRIYLTETNSETEYYAFNKRSTRLDVSYKLKKANTYTNPSGSFGKITYGIGTIESISESVKEDAKETANRYIELHGQLRYKRMTNKGNTRVHKIFKSLKDAKYAIAKTKHYPHLHAKPTITPTFYGHYKVTMRNLGYTTFAETLYHDKIGVAPISTEKRWQDTIALLNAAITQILITYAHLDLKPHNILFKNGKFYIVDVDGSTEIGMQTSTIGTIGYRAPEIIRLVERHGKFSSEAIKSLCFANKAYDYYSLGQMIAEIWGAQNIHDIIDYISFKYESQIAYSPEKEFYKFRSTAMAIWDQLKRPSCGSELFSGMDVSDEDQTALLAVIDGLMGPNDKNQRLSAEHALTQIQKQYSKWQQRKSLNESHIDSLNISAQVITDTYNFLNDLKQTISLLANLKIIANNAHANDLIDRALNSIDDNTYCPATFMRIANNITCIIRVELLHQMRKTGAKELLNALPFYPIFRKINPELRSEENSIANLLSELRVNLLSDTINLPAINIKLQEINIKLQKIKQLFELSIVSKLHNNLYKVITDSHPYTKPRLEKMLSERISKVISILLNDTSLPNEQELAQINLAYTTSNFFAKLIECAEDEDVEYIDCEPEYILDKAHGLIRQYAQQLSADTPEDILILAKELALNQSYKDVLEPVHGNRFHSFGLFKEERFLDDASSPSETEYFSNDENDIYTLFPHCSL